MTKSRGFATLASLSLILASNASGLQNKTEVPAASMFHKVSSLTLLKFHLFINYLTYSFI